MEAMWKDFRFALRTLRRSLSVTCLAIISLALAIAGNTTVFGLINGLLFRPLPYEEPHRIALVGEMQKDSPLAGLVAPASAANFVDWSDRQRSFSEMSAVRIAPVSLTAQEPPEQVSVAAVSPQFFSMLGVQTTQGRTFLEEEGVAGRDQVVVLSHRFWERRFGGQADTLGTVLEVDSEPYEIVGILPPEFEFLDPAIRLWVPLALDRSSLSRNWRDLFAVARMKPGVTHTQAEAEMKALASEMELTYPDSNRGYTVSVVNLREQIPDPRSRALLGLLQVTLILVLFIACINIANLLLARGHARKRELALRTSLGANSWRLVRQLFTESLLMATISGVLGLLLSVAGIRVMATVLASQLPSVYAPVVDARVVLFTLAMTVLGALLFGMAPMLQSAKVDLVSALKDGSQGASAGSGRRFWANALVVAEVSLALILLSGAGMLLQTFIAQQNEDPGFDTENLLTVQLSLSESQYAEAGSSLLGVEEMVARLERVPGISGVAASNHKPRDPFVLTETFTIDASPPLDGQTPPNSYLLTVSPEYREMLDIALEQGRFVAVDDRTDTEPVVVINRAMAKRFWGDADPIGERITLLGDSRRIVGVVGDVMHSVLSTSEGPQSTAYLPLAQRPLRDVTLIMRTEVEPYSLKEIVQKEIRAVDSDQAVPEIQTLTDFLAQFNVGSQIFSLILTAFGALALVLAILGTYGVLAYSVTQRNQEIGLRMAVGANRWQVVGMVLRQGLRLAFIGIAVGVPGVVLLARVISSALDGLVPVEPVTVVFIALVLAGATFLASVIPARRATRVDPVQALRGE